jgi:hypothetical protein
MFFSPARFACGRLMAAFALIAVGAAVRAVAAPSTPGVDPAALDLHNLKAEAADYLGRKAVRVTVIDPQKEAGLALLRGTDFQDGTIEADIALKITTPPGVRMPGFVGLAFRVKPDASAYDIVYLRPKNALADDQAMRNHAVQYCAEPDYGWYRLRREWAFVYESWADIAPETWIHMRIDVAGRTAKVFLNGSAKPSLVVDGLKGSSLHGGVGLWGYAGEESYFSNVRITPASPQPIKNGSDPAGGWAVKFGSDAGPFKGSLTLARDGDKLTGTWSGDLGEDKPVTGFWRDGHIELSFAGVWPNDGRDGAPGPVTAFMEGWVDDASAKGRMRVAGRADGQWVAQRQPQ